MGIESLLGWHPGPCCRLAFLIFSSHLMKVRASEFSFVTATAAPM